MKESAQSAAVQPLLLRINAIRPLTVDAATSNGWFDLQIARDSFGPLPAEDQALLSRLANAGLTPRFEPADGLARLLADQKATVAEVLALPSPPARPTPAQSTPK